ncbi:MAG: hypothetical protein M1814_002296 [Vezdaea aestivalis]|nr:MAG: hypothetical protein M1814_002296 [Vezdaea aestivalis]
MKDEPGPAKQLLWHFTHHRTSKLLNSTWSKNRKLIKWIFYNAMGEHRLTPGGESTQNMKPLSRERLDSKDTSPPGKLWFVKDKRPGDWSQHVKLLESYGGQGRKQSDESNVKGTVRVVVKQEIHLTKASELMAEARLIVIEVLRMAEIQRKSPQSLPDLSKVHGYNGRDSYGRQTPQAHQGSDDGS